MTELGKTETQLFDALNEITVIDSHEHLYPEKFRVSQPVDFLTLFSYYTYADFLAAGMSRKEEGARMRDPGNVSLEERWEIFSRYYPMIKYGSYARPARIWLKDVLGFDDLTEKNYKEVSGQMQEWNKPGIYKRILTEMCNIESVVVMGEPEHYSEYDRPLFKPLWRVGELSYTTTEYLRKFFDMHKSSRSKGIADYLDWMEEEFRHYAEIGVYGIKIMCEEFEEPDLQKADKLFKALQARDLTKPLSRAEQCTLSSVIYDRTFQIARAHDLVVGVHSGVWEDFRDSQPSHLIPVATRYPDVSFDLFHLGLPYAREAVMIGKMFPNVSLNLCWTSVLSPELTCQMLDECLDMIPINNLIVFGGDYGLPVEKVYGHLKMTKEIVARVLAKRIARGEMDSEEALRIAQMWFYDNAVRIYDLHRG